MPPRFKVCATFIYLGLDEDVTLDVEQHEIIALNPVNTVIIPPVPVVVTDPLIILARRTEEPPVKDSLNAPTLLGQVLGEDFATQTQSMSLFHS